MTPSLVKNLQQQFTKLADALRQSRTLNEQLAAEKNALEKQCQQLEERHAKAQKRLSNVVTKLEDISS